MTVIHEFSSGYYLVDGIVVEPTERADVPVVHEDVYDYIKQRYYEGRSTPILFKHSDAQYHFQIHPSPGVRVDSIEMPFEFVHDLDLDRCPDEEQFLLTKPKNAHELCRLSDPNTTIIEG